MTFASTDFPWKGLGAAALIVVGGAVLAGLVALALSNWMEEANRRDCDRGDAKAAIEGRASADRTNARSGQDGREAGEEIQRRHDERRPAAAIRSLEPVDDRAVVPQGGRTRHGPQWMPTQGGWISLDGSILWPSPLTAVNPGRAHSYGSRSGVLGPGGPRRYRLPRQAQTGRIRNQRNDSGFGDAVAGLQAGPRRLGRDLGGRQPRQDPDWHPHLGDLATRGSRDSSAIGEPRSCTPPRADQLRSGHRDDSDRFSARFLKRVGRMAALTNSIRQLSFNGEARKVHEGICSARQRGDFSEATEPRVEREWAGKVA